MHHQKRGMVRRQKINKGIIQVGKQPAVEKYHGRAQKYFNTKQSGQTAAVVETVFRKPKSFANLHEYDDTGTVDQVPTAIGFHSFDSADEVVEAKMKPRYDFEEPTMDEEEQLQDSKEIDPTEIEESRSKEEENKRSSTPSEQEHVPFHKVILRKAEHRAPNEEVVEKRQTVDSEKRQNEDEEEKEVYKDKTDFVEEEFQAYDRYDLGQSIFSDDDSCPPLWKSFSNENDGKLVDGRALTMEEKARRENALNEARRLRALNSINGTDIPTPMKIEIGVDPRLCRNRNEDQKKISSMHERSSAIQGADTKGKVREKSSPENITSSNRNGKDPTSIVSNSIIASKSPPRKVSVKAITIDKRFDDASYGSEGQSKVSEDHKQHTLPTETHVLAETEQSFAAYVYEGLTNLTNMKYWIGEQVSTDGSQDGGSRRAANVPGKGVSKRSSHETKSVSPAIVSEITIPTPTVRSKREPHMEDSVSILGLNKKQMDIEPVENGENLIPQKQKKRKGKSRVFGKILGRKAAA